MNAVMLGTHAILLHRHCRGTTLSASHAGGTDFAIEAPKFSEVNCMATPRTTQKPTREPDMSFPSTTDKNQPSTHASAASNDEPRGIGDELRQLVRDKAYEQIGSQKERATGTLGAVAGAVRNATHELRERGQTGLAGYVNRAADEIDRWTSRLREQDLDDAVRDVQQFARRNPAIFLGVAFGAGVVAARFLKSSGAGGTTDNRQSSAWTAPSSYGETPSVAHDAPDLGRDLSVSREGF
jgi:hypothetical protein